MALQLIDPSRAIINTVGTAPNGGTANSTKPVITGTADAGNTVSIYDGIRLLGTATVAANGTWSYTPTIDLKGGSHQFAAIAMDKQGNLGASSVPLNVSIPVLIATPPQITSVVDAVGPVQGPIANGGVTDDSHPTINGTGIPGDTVNIFQNGTSCGTTIVDGTGHFSLKITGALSNGVHNMTATQFAAGQQQSASSNSWAITVDTTTPAKPATPVLTDDSNAQIPAGSTTPDAHPHISGTGSAGDTITVYDGSKVIGSTTIGSDGKWTFTPSPDLSPASHDISVIETNKAGAVSPSSDHVAFTVDPRFVVPTETVTIQQIIDHTSGSEVAVPNGGSIRDTSPTLTGVISSASLLSGEVVMIYRDGSRVGTATMNGNTWTFTDSGVTVGDHTYIARVQNQEANGPNSAAFSVTEVSPPTAETVSITSLTDHYSPTGIVPQGGECMDPAPTVHGTVSSTLLAGEALVVYRDGVKIGNATMAGTSWSFNDSGVAVGNHTYTARVESSAANGAYSNSWSIAEVALLTNGITGIGVATGNVTGVAMGDIVIPGWGTSYYTSDLQAILTDSYGNTWNYSHSTNYDNLPNGGPFVVAVVLNRSVTYTTTVIRVSDGARYVIDVHTGAQILDSASGTGARIPTAGGHPVQLSATRQIDNVVTSDEASVSSATDAAVLHDTSSTSTSAPASNHAVVGTHDAFTGTSGHDTVDLNADPMSYFKETTAHIQGSTVHPTQTVDNSHETAVPAVNTLHLTGDHQVLDLTSLTGKTAASKISGIEIIDLGGHANTVKLSLTDVLNLGEADLFVKDGKQQVMLNGSNGDTVDLSNTHIAGVAEGQWQQEGTAQVGGVMYDVYEHSGAHAELLVQHGVQIAIHN